MDTSEFVADILKHTGVKGMKWGVRRKATVGPQEVIVRDSRLGRGLKTKGGGGHPATVEAIRARRIGQIGKKSGLKSLTDKELGEYARRIQLEQNVKRLHYADSGPAHRFVLTLLGQTGKNTASNVSQEVATQQVRKRLIKIGALAAS